MLPVVANPVSNLLSLPLPGEGIPSPPPAALDPFLDAAARCFARHGIGRTSVQDVARELGIDRTTVYRQVGTIDQQVRLLLARDLNRLLLSISSELDGRSGAEVLVEVLDVVVSFARAHPVLAKVLAHEPELLGPFLVADLPALIDRITVILAPLLGRAMDEDHLARRDPLAVAEWLVRIGVSLILAPPPVDTRTFLAELLLPALSPGGSAP